MVVAFNGIANGQQALKPCQDHSRTRASVYRAHPSAIPYHTAGVCHRRGGQGILKQQPTKTRPNQYQPPEMLPGINFFEPCSSQFWAVLIEDRLKARGASEIE